MKTINLLSLNSLKACIPLVLSLICIHQLNAQVYIEQSGANLDGLEVTEYDKELIITTTTEVLTKYVDIATFLSPTGQFSEEKYADFLGLFTGGAKVFNDVVKKDGGNIDYAVYADNVYQYMQGTGVKFEMNDVYLDKIEYDSGGFYVVTLSMEKLMLNGLNDSNVPVNYNNGIPVPMKMMIEMPDYDITQGSIISILGKPKQTKIDRSAMLTLDVLYSLGSVFKENNTDYNGFEEDVEYPVSYNSYGAEMLYKLSLNNSKRLWAVIGAQVVFHNYDIDLSAYNAEDNLGLSMEYYIGGLRYKTNQEELELAEVSTRSIFELEKGSSLNEELQVIAIEIPIGVSYNISNTYDYDFNVDLTINPYYSITSSGRIQSDGDVTVYNIPVHFTDQMVDKLFQPTNSDLLNTYYTSTTPNTVLDEVTESQSQFSLSLMLAPNFHYKFNYQFALEVGANIQYNFLPLFTGEHNSGIDNQSLLSYTQGAETVYTSTLQHYFTNVNLLRYGAKVGIVYKFQ